MKNLTLQISMELLAANLFDLIARKKSEYLSINRSSIAVLLFILLTMCTSNITAQWQNVGTPGFSGSTAFYQRIAIHDGIPYVVYRDDQYGSRTTVVKYDGLNWVYVGLPGFSANGAHYHSFVFGGSTPYVSFNDAGHGGKGTVMKFDGTSWSIVGTAGFTPAFITYSSLAIVGNTPYLAFCDEGNGFRTSVMKFDGTNWVNVGTAGFSTGHSVYQSLAFDGNTPYVAFADLGSFGYCNVMKFNGTNWETVGIPNFSNGGALFESLVIIAGTPYVAFEDFGNGEKCSVMKFDGTNWVNVGSPGFSAGRVFHVNLAFFNNTPYVGFTDEANGVGATVMKFDGINWVYVGSPGFSAGSTESLSFAMKGSIPYVAYQDYANGLRTTVMRFGDDPYPVELSSFSSYVNTNNVNLNWTTSSETNNSGFDLERRNAGSETQDVWNKIAFINGHGTTTSPNNYEFTDRNLYSGKYNYRLKQIDFNGNYEYFDLTEEVEIGVPDKFELLQNYPNPFNPVTNLEFGISNLEFVSLKVYDAMGKEVATLVNEIKPAGRYDVTFDGSNLGSGIYFYKIETGSFTAVKRMILIK